VVITCHDLGRHLGRYGVTSVQTPNLDALAAGGARFERAFATSSGCSPSRAALATGCYPHTTGVMGLSHPPFNWDLIDGAPHITQMLAGSGYERHLFGFQHVTTNPYRLAFDELHGFDRVTGCHETALGSSVASRVTAFLRGRRSSRPLYLEINLEEAHRPYDQGGSVPDESRGVSVPPYLPETSESREEVAALQGAIHQGDRAVGQIVTALDETGMRGGDPQVYARAYRATKGPLYCRVIEETLAELGYALAHAFGAAFDNPELLVCCVVLLAIFAGPPKLGTPPNPANVDAFPRPDWYLLWYYGLLALLRPAFEDYVIVLLPLFGFLLLFLIPFLSRSGQRSPRRRPWAPAAVVGLVVMIGALWRFGEVAPWSPNFPASRLTTQQIGASSGPVFDGGRLFYDKGCQFCHTIDGQGGIRGPDLTHVGDRLSAGEITAIIADGPGNMPAYVNNLTPDEMKAR